MTSLFISYSRKDSRVAQRLTEYFSGQGLEFWIDWGGIPPSVDWWKEIEKGIEGASVFLFLISPDSLKSKVCRQEIDHAIKNGKRLIPLVVRDANGEEVPTELGRLNWIYFREVDDFNLSFSKLISAIQTDYDWVQAHRQLQVKALEWERNGRENSFLLFGKELQDAEFQLATNTSKEPYPTDLQREYVHISRRAVDRRRARNMGLATSAAIALAVLAVFGFVQAKLATDRANIALARQLAAQAQSINATRSSKQRTAVLLAIRSMQILPSAEAAEVLQNNSLAIVIGYVAHSKNATSAVLSPDGKYVASRSEDGFTRVWEAVTGKEIFQMTHDQPAYPVAFSPGGKYLLTRSGDGSEHIWEALTGKEIVRVVHDREIWSVAFSPDSKYVISVGCDKPGNSSYDCAQGSARVWETLTGKEIARTTHDQGVSRVAFSPDGKYVVSGGYDGTARVWEALTGKEIAGITEDYAVSSVAFSPDGKYVVSVGHDSARVWEALTGKVITRITPVSFVSPIIFSPDGKYVASGSYENTARVWEAYTGKEIARMAFDEAVSSVAFSPDGKYVVFGSYDNTARMWDTFTGTEIARTTYDQDVLSIAFSDDGKYVVSVGKDGSVRMWMAPPERKIDYMLHGKAVSSVAFSPNGKYVATGSYDEFLRVWETSTGEQVARMTHDQGVSSVAFSPDGKYVVSVGHDSARIWEALTGKEITRVVHDREISSIAFSPDSKYVISGGCDKPGNPSNPSYDCAQGSARVWETLTGKELARMVYDQAVGPVAFSPNGKYVISGGCDKAGNPTSICIQGSARVWEAFTGKEITRTIYTNRVLSVSFSPDGKYVVAGSQGGSASVWEAMTGKEITRVVHDEGISAITFSPNGEYIVSGGWDGSARVWEILTGREIAHMTHDNPEISISTSSQSLSLILGGVTSIALTSDGKYVVSGGSDGSARIWETLTGKEIARMTYHEPVSSVAFSPDGRYVVSGSWDKTFRLRLYRPEDLITESCARVTRNLTRSEWRQYIGLETYQAICPNLAIEPEVTAIP